MFDHPHTNTSGKCPLTPFSELLRYTDVDCPRRFYTAPAEFQYVWKVFGR